MTYKDAENAFIASLTREDTLTVVALGNQFFNYIDQDSVELALDMLYVVDDYVLYKIADESKDFLRPRFSKSPALGWSFVRYSFSTQSNNDLIYLYNGIKLAFNPIKVDDLWYLTLKDGNQSSKDMLPSDQPHPNTIAPYPIRLNKQTEH